MEFDFIIFPTPNKNLSEQMRTRNKPKFKEIKIPAQTYDHNIVYTQNYDIPPYANSKSTKPIKHQPQHYNLNNLRNIIKNHKMNQKDGDASVSFVETSRTNKQNGRQDSLNQVLEALKNLDQSISNINPPVIDQTKQIKKEYFNNKVLRQPMIKKDISISVEQSLNIGPNEMDENVVNNIQTNQVPFDQKRGSQPMINEVKNNTKNAFLSPQRIMEYQSPSLSNQNLFNTERNKKQNQQLIYTNKQRDIPCILLHNKQQQDISTNDLIIYFHGNGEDIFQAFDLLDFLRTYLNINILAVEYPGYSNYIDIDSKKTKSEIIQEDSLFVYDFLVHQMQVKPKQIIVLGRSIGSGPSTYLASKRQVGGLVLISPFISLRQVVTDYVGYLASSLIRDRFRNIDIINSISCPCLFIHGQSDTVVQKHHSMALYDHLTKQYKQIVMPLKMDHIQFDFETDLAQHIFRFLIKQNVYQNDHKTPLFPAYCYF